MLVFGAIDFAAAVARVGSFLGYHVTVCDARPVFATGTRFPDADEVVVDWPHRYLAARGRGRAGSTRRTVLCVLTHDPKFDVPAARGGAAAARGRLRRRDGLAAHPRRPARPGCARPASPSEEIARLSSPIGLDLGARTPEETAISIAAEIIGAAGGAAAGGSLAGTDGPHPPRRPARADRPPDRRAGLPRYCDVDHLLARARRGARHGRHPSKELHARRLASVRAWTTFVEHGDAAAAAGPPRDHGAAGRCPGPRSSPDVAEAPLADEARHRRRAGASRPCRPPWPGSRPSCVVPPRTATWCSRSPTRRPGSCGPTAAA